MTSPNLPALALDPQTLRSGFDKAPFGFLHSLSGLSLFSEDSLLRLTERYSQAANERCSYHYIAMGAQKPGTRFTSVPMPQATPLEAMRRLGEESIRIVLKRPEDFDEGFRDLLQQIFREIVDALGGLGGDRVLRLEGGLLVSSAATTTPFHFDPEVNFFCQIEGEKIYHVYAPEAVSEAELERYYRLGRRTICEVELETRDPRLEHVFTLGPGLGLHQPEHAAHWVQTRAERAISYAVVFETESMRARARARAANFHLRRLAMRPAQPGAHPLRDAVKSEAMRLVLPMRTTAADAVRKLRSARR